MHCWLADRIRDGAIETQGVSRGASDLHLRLADRIRDGAIETYMMHMSFRFRSFFWLADRIRDGAIETRVWGRMTPLRS